MNDELLSWRSIFEALPDGSVVLDGHGDMRHVNDLLCALTGYTRDELVGHNVEMLVPERHRNLEFLVRSEVARDPSARLVWSDRDLSVLRRDGSELPVDFALTPLNFDGHHWAIGSIRDNSSKRLSEQARREAEMQFRLAFEDNMAPMVITDLDDCIVRTNDAFCHMVGRSRQELIGFDSKLFTYPDDVGITEASHDRMLRNNVSHIRYVKRYLHRDGRVIFAEVSKSPVVDEDGGVRYFIISERDITEEKALTAKLSFQALHDPLTGLANRALFEDRLTQTLSRMKRSGGSFALLLIDLDDFKKVNDDLGHLVGDALLVEVASRFSAVTREADTLCRFGGDEFLYLAEGLCDDDDPVRIAQRLLNTLQEPFKITDFEIVQHATMGVAVGNVHDVNRIDVIRNADIALLNAKRSGKGGYALYVADFASDGDS
ncbi:MAG: PAS domain S-box protein [Acidimicrobiaceae bacterium]|nr:PAS domain S-box protein [Acidimicrobiaceae bacterium]